MRYDPDKTMLGTMLNDPEVVAILEKHAPGITKNPMIGMAKGMTANQALVMGAAMLGGQTVVDAVREDIAQLS
jgi:urease gamma subunit